MKLKVLQENIEQLKQFKDKDEKGFAETVKKWI
jgi:hypothetical protein